MVSAGMIASGTESTQLMFFSEESTCPAVCSNHRSFHLSCVYSSCVTFGECKDAKQRMCWTRSWWKRRLCVILELFIAKNICVSNVWASHSLPRNWYLREKNYGWVRIVKNQPTILPWPPWVVGAREQSQFLCRKSSDAALFWFHTTDTTNSVKEWPLDPVSSP